MPVFLTVAAHKEKDQLAIYKTMKIISFLLYILVLETVNFSGVAAITRDDFPPGFIFGAGTSAYQVEGAVAEDGRKPSVWDTYAHAGGNLDHSHADIAADQYHKYKEDVRLMHEMGLDAYRFSISWSRLIPDGRGPVNPKGLQYYNNLINELILFGIEPLVTLFHFDLPQALEDEYQGLLSRRIVADFTAYADICFKEFGDRVKHWMTFNEPNFEPILGHDLGIFPPGRCSYPFGINCSKGDSTTEPYLFAHNSLLSHSSAVALYKDKYQAKQGGQIGLTIIGFWFEPFTNSSDDIDAANRAMDFHIGWFMNPLIHGNYPAIMRETVGSRLPTFNAEELKQLKGSFDFIGFNHYSMLYLQAYINNFDKSKRDYLRDVSAKPAGIPFPGSLENSIHNYFKQSYHKRQLNDILSTKELPPMEQFPIIPWAFQRMLEYIKVTYGNPPLMIHENGDPDFNVTPTSGNGTDDNHRTNYLQGYLEALLQSIRNGSNTRGYFVWSFIDCFELMFGYTARYGLYGVDFNRADRRRYPRQSAIWYANFLKSNQLTSGTSSVNIHTE